MNNLSIYKSCHLFEGIQDGEMEHVLQCLGAKERTYQKHEIVIRRGEIVEAVGIVLAGNVHIIKEDFWGNRTIIAEVGIGETFAEVYAATLKEPIEVEILANSKSNVVFLNMRELMQLCHSQCSFHNHIIRNFMTILATKNLFLTRKMEHISKRSTREKILSYLSEMSLKQGGTTIILPFNRQEMADYLSVERSAMSRELGKMQKDGIITVNKNVFRLLLRKEDMEI